jgi:hypothetical protein
MRFEVFTAVKMSMLVFCAGTPLVDINFSDELALKMEAVCSSKKLVSAYNLTRL